MLFDTFTRPERLRAYAAIAAYQRTGLQAVCALGFAEIVAQKMQTMEALLRS